MPRVSSEEKTVLELTISRGPASDTIPWETVARTAESLTAAAEAIHKSRLTRPPPLRVSLSYSRSGSLILGFIVESLDLDLKWVAQNVVWEILWHVLEFALLATLIKKGSASAEVQEHDSSERRDPPDAMRSAEVRTALARMLTSATAEGDNPSLSIKLSTQVGAPLQFDRDTAAGLAARLSGRSSARSHGHVAYVRLVKPNDTHHWLVQWRGQDRVAQVLDRRLIKAANQKRVSAGQILFVEVAEEFTFNASENTVSSSKFEIARLLYPSKL